MKERSAYIEDVTQSFLRTFAAMACQADHARSFAEGARAAVILVGVMQELNVDQEIAQEVVRNLTWEMSKTNYSESVFMNALQKWRECYCTERS